MSERSCEQWQEAVATRLFGELPLSESVALDAHLEGCADCRALEAEMTETYSMLRFVDPAAIAAGTEIPASLSERVLGDLNDSAQRQRRTRSLRAWSAVGVGAVAAALILVGVLSGRAVAPTPVERTVALAGAPSVTASATLIARSWGTTVDLREKGLPSGTLYTVSMEGKDGRWWTAGTYRSVEGRTIDATMACAVALEKITDVKVVNGEGKVVLWNYHAHGTDE